MGTGAQVLGSPLVSTVRLEVRPFPVVLAVSPAGILWIRRRLSGAADRPTT